MAMNSLFVLLLIFLEITFISVVLAMLHHQRKVIGPAAFYLTLGFLFLFAQFVCAVDVRAVTFGYLEFPLAPTVFFMPYLAALLLVYVTAGTVAAQRLIIGSLVLFGVFLYLGELMRIEIVWHGFSISPGVSSEALDTMLSEGRRTMSALALAHLADLFLLPVIFTWLKNLHCRLYICTLGALACAELVDMTLYTLVENWGRALRPELLLSTLAMRLAAAGYLATLLTFYLTRIERESRLPRRSSLDIFFVFFGGARRTRLLEKNIREWEGRYQKVLENASEMVLLLAPSGEILDANRAAAEMMRAPSPGHLIGTNFYRGVRSEEPGEIEHRFGQFIRDGGQLHLKLQWAAQSGENVALSCSVSPIRLQNRDTLVLLGRDVTEENRLASERETLQEQLRHSQRLESLGRLAGGIAHDFNNHIHAILGYVDLLQLRNRFDDSVNTSLNKIAEIAEQSGKLTGQLLGFAHKGKYCERALDAATVVRGAVGLFLPDRSGEIAVIPEIEEVPMPVRGDEVQLQQVLLNLMINARDALREVEGPREIRVRAHVAAHAGSGMRFAPPPDAGALKIEDYVLIEVADNGCGISEEAREKLFEPFFTTKPIGEGTGMGLAMAYGTISHHHGWIEVVSEPGKGSSFGIFLPLDHAVNATE